MKAAGLMKTLRERGIRAQIVDGDLKVGARTSALTPELMSQLKRRKAELVELLENGTEEDDVLHRAIEQASSWDELSTLCTQIDQAYRQGELEMAEVEQLTARVTEKSRELPEKTPRQTLGALLSEHPVQRVRSKVLGEDVLWAADDAEIPEDNTLVVYRERELRQLEGRLPEELQAIHRCKRGLDMELVEPGEDEGERIDGEVLLAHAADDRCYACGKSNWWTKTNGHQICAICHPQPRLQQGEDK